MLRLALALWLLLLVPASAQVVTVQSGQHDGFTRLVLTLPEPGGWDFGRTADGYAFSARRGTVRYDLSTVYQRIARDRLSALWVDPDTGVLRLGLGCDCHAIATPFRPGIIVIDIADGPAPSASPFEAAFANAGRSVPMVAEQAAVRPRARPSNLKPPGLTPAPQATVTLPPPNPGERPASAALLPTIPLEVPSGRSSALRDALLRDLSRGIAQGAVTPVQAVPPPPAAAAAPMVAEAATDGQVAVRQPGVPPRVDRTIQGQACIADDRLDLAAWGDAGSAADQLARGRTGLMTEFDRPDRDSVLRLARLHLHLGFGAEARSLVRLLSPPDAETAMLDALGILVDGSGNAPVFAGMLGCPTAASLWAALATPDLAKAEPHDRTAILKAFSALPVGLRRHLGPILSDRFLAVGDAAAARTILETVNRAAGPHGEAIAMVDARLDLAEGRTTEAEPKLRAIVADDGLVAARALATLIDTTVAAGAVPAGADLVALEAYLLEHRGLPDTAALSAALSRGLTAAGAAPKAFGRLAASDTALAAELWDLLVLHGDDAAMVSLAVAPPGPAVAGLPSATRLAVARRITAIGFPDVAQRWAEGLTGPDADLLLAEIALDLRDGRGTLRHLAGQESAQAARLRAAALELLGDLDGAVAAWQAAGDPDEVARLRFLQQRWDAIGPTDESALSGLVAALNDSVVPPEPGVESPSLAAAKALVEATAAVRSDITQVLAARPVPEN